MGQRSLRTRGSPEVGCGQVIWSRLSALLVVVAVAGCGDDDTQHPSDGSDAGVDAGADPCAGREAYDSCEDDETPGLCVFDNDCVLKCQGGSFECFVGHPCACNSACYYTPDGNYCFEEGQKAEGEVCESHPDCAAPGQCLQTTEADEAKCFLVCDDARPCATGTCIDTELGFSVCVAESASDGGIDAGP